MGLVSKGEGSWLQARDLSRWEFATISKTSVFQASFFYNTRGYAQILLEIICAEVQNRKTELICVQVKNKPCMVYTIMRLIPWKQSHGS
jgi:hypothetical protein